jgi:predicted ATPase
VFKRGTPPDALYTFKHALVQDAAYDSLLKTRRAQLHARIAETLERDFADVTANEPEVLAHHFTQARLHARAVPYWVQAGQRALERVAPAEAVGHLDKALSTNQLIPPSVERDRQELNIRILLGTAHLTYRGWAATEIIQALRPARDLAVRLGEGDKLRSVLFFAYVHHQIRSEYPAVLEVVEQTYALARSRSDSNALLLAPYYEVQSACAMGDFEHARLAMDQMLAEYDVERHRHLVLTYGLDPKCDALVWAGYWLWALGYPDQAREAAEEQLELARLLRHPFNLCWSLTGGTHGLLLLGEASLVRQWVESAAEIARENAMSFVAEVMAPMFDGCALIEAGQHSEGYTSLAEGLRIWRGAGAMHTVPIALQMLARASIALQRFDDAKVHLDDALDVIERTGHRVCEAEVYRVRGELQRQRPPADTAAAEASFRKALKIATTQHAKGFELRAAMSLARLWQDQDKRRDAHDLLAPIYNWFTEGFETKDLKEARALLDELRA